MMAATIIPVSYGPFLVLGGAVASVVVAIAWLRLHAFLALILAAFLVGFLTRNFPSGAIERLPSALRDDARANPLVAAIELTSVEFGVAAGSIAISIGLAAIIGLGLMESGAADKVVRRFLAVFGEKRAAWALLASTYFLSIPIFFDTMFMLMIPLARALRLRTGKDYLLYVMAVCCAAIVTHSVMVPHPGPLAMVENLRVDAGQSLLWGLAAGIVPCVIGFIVAAWINRRTDVPLRETTGVSAEELHAITNKPESELPSFGWSISPVLIPIALIGAASFCKMLSGYPAAVHGLGGAETFARIASVASFVGNKNVALALGAGLALWLLARRSGHPLSRIGEMIEAPLSTAAVIILITAAGGAFGAMLRHAGVGDAIKGLAQSYNIDLLLLAGLTATGLRIAQGSATVSMLTTSAIIWPMLEPGANAALPFHPMYVFLAIGFGSFGGSWMNDSGFWVVSRLGGLTTRETLRSWSVLVTLVSFSGLMLTLLFSRVLPLG